MSAEQASRIATVQAQTRSSRIVGDRRLAARALMAFALASARYWPTLALAVRRQVRHWESRAAAIEDDELRALALSKLHAERFNAEAAAIAATLAPSAHRRDAARAIVALQLMFDYLDGLTERPFLDPLGEGERLFQAFLGAIDAFGEKTAAGEAPDGGEYLHELGHAVTVAIASLPSGEAVAPVARRCAARAAQAQIRMHAAATLGTAQLQRWAQTQASDSGLEWREYLAGAASSVLALHALIAAAADPRTTREEAERIDRVYMSICVVVTLLDGLVDHHLDSATGTLSYVSLYDDPGVLAGALTRAAREAAREAAALRRGAHHVMTLAGAIAYGASSPGASGELARPVLSHLRRQLPPFILPPLLLMRTWRAGKRARACWRGNHTDAAILSS